MNTEMFANSNIGKIFIRIMAAIMESQFRLQAKPSLKLAI